MDGWRHTKRAGTWALLTSGLVPQCPTAVSHGQHRAVACGQRKALQQGCVSAQEGFCGKAASSLSPRSTPSAFWRCSPAARQNTLCCRRKTDFFMSLSPQLISNYHLPKKALCLEGCFHLCFQHSFLKELPFPSFPFCTHWAALPMTPVFSSSLPQGLQSAISRLGPTLLWTHPEISASIKAHQFLC